VIAHHGYSTWARAGEPANMPAAAATKTAAANESNDVFMEMAFPRRYAQCEAAQSTEVLKRSDSNCAGPMQSGSSLEAVSAADRHN